jgi:hypothetical protein
MPEIPNLPGSWHHAFGTAFRAGKEGYSNFVGGRENDITQTAVAATAWSWKKEKKTQKDAGDSECSRKQKAYAHFSVCS